MKKFHGWDCKHCVCGAEKNLKHHNGTCICNMIHFVHLGRNTWGCSRDWHWEFVLLKKLGCHKVLRGSNAMNFGIGQFKWGYGAICFIVVTSFERESQVFMDWSETTLIYWMMVERYPNLKEEVSGSIPSCLLSSLLDINFPGGQLPPYALVLACWPSISNKQKIIPPHTHTSIHGHGIYIGGSYWFWLRAVFFKLKFLKFLIV